MGGGGGEEGDAKWTAPQTTAQTLDEELTMWACTYGIDRWMPAKLVGRLTAKLVDCLTAWLLSLWTAWLRSLWTAATLN